MRPARTVLLRHFDIPPGAGLGSDHYDWMIEPYQGAPALVTFRVSNRIDVPDLKPWTFPAERLGDHRRDYLAYEGPVSGGRGRVRRVASGQVVAFEEHGERLAVAVRFDGNEGMELHFAGGPRKNGYVFSVRTVDVT